MYTDIVRVIVSVTSNQSMGLRLIASSSNGLTRPPKSQRDMEEVISEHGNDERYDGKVPLDAPEVFG